MSDVCVVGLGKIGLPLACAIARGGHRVRGLDISNAVVDQVNRGEEPFPGEAGLGEALSETVGTGALSATLDAEEAAAGADVVIVVVPLIVDESATPDFRAMDAATDAVGAVLSPGVLVSYETTLPVGTTRKRFTPALEKRSGLTAGDDLFVVHSPERVFSGRIFGDLRRYPKLIGGVDTASAERGVTFYESFLEFDERPDLDRPNGVWDLGSVEAAELAKLAETTYRDINIAFANELAAAAESAGVDVYPVIEACNSQPFSHIHQPGISVGGHCIPVYPHFLLSGFETMRMPRVAREVNAAQPRRAVAVVEAALGALRGRSVAVLGVTYRGAVKEFAFSGAFPLVDELRRRGAEVSVHDPLLTRAEIIELGLHPYDLDRKQAVDAVILHTDHPEYASLTDRDFPSAELIYDGRRILRSSEFGNLQVLGRGDARQRDSDARRG